MIKNHPFETQLPQQTPSLRLRAMKLTANVHRAEDLVQTTLLKAWASREHYTQQTNLRAWLFTILRNTFFSELRKYRREVEDINGIHALRLAEEPRQQAALELKELLAVMARLPDTQHRAILLMSAYGFSQLEAAEDCNCTVGTIKSRVSRGRATLLDHFNDEGEQANLLSDRHAHDEHETPCTVMIAAE